VIIELEKFSTVIGIILVEYEKQCDWLHRNDIQHLV
jgi:hypothetical protein